MSYHDPVLLTESVDGLNIQPNGIYVDLTYGGGGHSQEILKRLEKGKLFVFDQDADAKSNIIDDERLVFIAHNFRYLRNFLKYYGVDKVDGILGDLGVSSHHFDDMSRGFSFRENSSLDMRMNQKSDLTAAYILNHYPIQQLTKLLKTYGELPNGYKIAQRIDQGRKEKPIDEIDQLKSLLKRFTPARHEHKFLAKVFQALRIEVNQEMESLKEVLMQSLNLLNKNGRLSIISYHSLEDRLVKNFIKAGNFEGKIEKDFYGNVLSPFEIISRKVIVPTDEEIEQNNRARSAKLRIAELK